MATQAVAWIFRMVDRITGQRLAAVLPGCHCPALLRQYLCDVYRGLHIEESVHYGSSVLEFGVGRVPAD